MKFFSKLRERMRKNLIKNQSGQGATEYILLLVVVVGLVLAFGKQIKGKFIDQVNTVGTKMDEVNQSN